MGQSSIDLSEVIAACRKGDRRAQNRLFEMFFGKMMGAAMRYISDRDEAQDVAQNGFVKVFSNLDKYNGEGSFEGWMRRIISNTAIDHIRKNKKNMISIDQSGYDWLADEGDEELKWNETLKLESARVMEEIQQLSPAYRLVFNLYVIEDYSHQEIAEMLDISVGTSKSNLSKAKRNLLKRLVKFEHE